jgi:formylglycine-generating enzyme required for sulfatase activity
VRLTLPFYLGVFEVTQGQFQDVMQANPSRFQNVDRPHTTHEFPVDRVTWMEAMEFCRRLSALPSERRAGRVYRLPTEAEWEFACRAGNESAYHFGEDVEELKSHGWFAGNTERSTQPVGRKLPNSLGLYDMYGNVWEWCSDWYAPYDTRELVTEDPRGAEQGEYRVLRGGSWLSPPENCRSADRGSEAPRRRCDRIGFRVLMMVGPIPEASASRLLTERAWEFMPLATASQLFDRAAANEVLR